MPEKPEARHDNNRNRPNFWGFLQNVLIAALNKGQLLGMFFGLIILIIIIKIPNEQIPELIKDLTNISKINSILGWILGVITTFGGYVLIRWQKHIHTKEIQRISQEKKRLQEKLTNSNLPTSKKT